MDGRGGCCITRYSDCGGRNLRRLSYNISKVDQIMLKFRPIAPKPITSGSGSSSSTVDNADGGTKRRKRKYVRSSNQTKPKKNTKDDSPKKRKVTPSSSAVSNGGETTEKVVNPVTLPLMPETPDTKKTSPFDNMRNISFNSHVTRPYVSVSDSGHVTIRDNTRNTQSVSLVTMECVMDTWMSPDVGLGFVIDQTRIMNMEIDPCPSFVTNSRDMVVWTNKAYREMTSDVGADVTVVNKCNRVIMPVYCSGFTCKMKVTWGSQSAPLHVTAPCDVWRLRSGGYAWRLDVKAALCLGR